MYCICSRKQTINLLSRFSWPKRFSGGRLMALSMAPLIKTNQTHTYIEDTILQAQNKAELFEIIPKYLSLLRTAGLKVSPEKKHFPSDKK